MRFIKKITAIIFAVILFSTSFSAVAEETQEQPIKILFLGNSLIYCNELDTRTFSQLCTTAGKNVEVTSVTESGTTLYRLSSEKTDIGKKALQTLEEGDFDYVILQPSRRVSPFEYSVYHAEYAAALKLNGIINSMGAKTLLLASAGLNTGSVPVYTMNESGIGSTTTYSLPIERKTHQIFFKNLAYELSREMLNAQVIDLGDAVEYSLESFPDTNFYQSDNRHPNKLGSYITGACIYSVIFNESLVGVNYTDGINKANVVLAQRAAAVAVLGEDKQILVEEKCDRTINATLTSNTSANISWEEPKNAEYYNVYRRESTQSYSDFTCIGSTAANQLSYTDLTLEKGKKYYYRIKAVHKVGDIEFESPYSDYAVVETLSRPNKPKLELVNKNTAKITITAVQGATQYGIYRKTEGSDVVKYIGNTDSLEYVDSTMKAGKTYLYSVVAMKQNGEVKSDNSYSRTIVALNTPKVKLSSAKKRRVNITINSVKGADRYAIYIKRSGDTKYTLYKTTVKTQLTVKKLKSGKVCYFKFRACKGKLSNLTASKYKSYSIKVK